MKKPRVAIVGYGQFGRFMATHLRAYCTIVPIRRDTDPKKVSTCDVVIFSVPWNSLESVIDRLKPHVQPGTAVVDVMSVKQKPLQLLRMHFPDNPLLGTHPIFGPQSGKQGIVGLPIVLCNVSFSKRQYADLKRFLKKNLQLKVIEQTPKQHDSDMAHVQALTHFIGRAIAQMNITSHLTNTKSYEQLLELKQLLQDDSWELFETIQNTNSEAKVIRQSFLRQLHGLEDQLD